MGIWTQSPEPRASQVVLVVENPPANTGDVRDLDLTPGSGRSPGGGHGNPLQYSCLENPMDRRAWWATVHGVAKSWTWLTRLSTHACMHAPEPKHLTIIEIFGITVLCPVWSLVNWCYEHAESLGWRYQKQEMRPVDLDLLGAPKWSPVSDRSLFPQLMFMKYCTFSSSCPPPRQLTWWSTSSWAVISGIFASPPCQSAEMEPLSWGTVCCDCPVSLKSSPWPVRAFVICKITNCHDSLPCRRETVKGRGWWVRWRTVAIEWSLSASDRVCVCVLSCRVMSNSLRPFGL